MPERVIIDTDPGIDDALALILALRSPELEVVAVTTVSGNVPVDVATRNVLTVFSVLSLTEPPPVARGSSKPLKKAPVFATSIHGEDGLGGLYEIRDTSGHPRYTPLSLERSNRDAADEILFHLSSKPESLTLITLGPLTNIATAIKRDGSAMRGVKGIVLMGGAVTVPGNVTAAAEFNIHADPEAARIVLDSGMPLTMVGLDVTRRVRLDRETVEKKIGPCKTTVSQFVCDCTRQLFSMSQDRGGNSSFPLHDPLAVGVALDPSLVCSKPMHIEVETKGRLTEGMTMADRRPVGEKASGSPNAQVCLDVDASRFLSLFLERLCRE
ncbi:MAG: nucleoside hydrolase [Proteobacteria bacterium]|nr:nucleoside hydrolase [Pseudomonadota bacterium]